MAVDLCTRRRRGGPARSRARGWGAAWSGWPLVLLATAIFLCPGLGASPARSGDLCGDGTTEGNETCDDSNTVSGDGCSSNCLLEVCGDGVLTPDTEACDDGNTTAGDGCAADCTCEAEVCGDGIKGCTEACDDGNTNTGDGCAPDCTCEPEVCGDGIDGCLEECDDGNTVDGDGCDADCTLTASCSPSTKSQLACVRAINRNLAGVIKAQSADDAACLRSVAAGKTPAIGDCLGEDVRGRVEKAQARTRATDGRKCDGADEIPTFSYVGAAAANGAGAAHPLAAAGLVLGGAPSVVLKSADRAGAACQAEVMKQLGAVANRWAAEANEAKARALEGNGCNSSELVAAAIDLALASNLPLGRAEARATKSITRRCAGAQVAAGLFACNGASTAAELAACVVAAAEEGACNAFEAADALELDCPTVPAIP